MDHFFVTCKDGDKTAMLLGPFTNEELCKKYAYGEYWCSVRDACYDIDPKSHFYAFGMCKIPLVEMCPFNYKGVLNKADPKKWNGVLA